MNMGPSTWSDRQGLGACRLGPKWVLHTLSPRVEPQRAAQEDLLLDGGER
jgi:hypothetical protein